MAEVRTVPIDLDDFITYESLRLVSKINQTDPCTREYAQLLENIERFSCAATMFPDMWSRFSAYYEKQHITFDDPPVAKDGEPEIIYPKFEVVTATEEPEQTEKSEEAVETSAEAPAEESPKEEPTAEAPAEETTEAPTYDEATVKKAIGKARADGKLPKIKDWLMDNFGVEGFSALPASKYGEAIEKLKAMGVAV